MKKNLFLRTDILPEEIPVLFSNKNVYLNFTENKTRAIFDNDKVFQDSTVPFYFYIPKSKGTRRKMSLLHPIAQIQVFSYVLKNEQLIIAFCKNSPFSVRSPIKRNFPKIKDITLQQNMITKLDEEFNFTNKLSISSDENQLLFYNYFSYNKHKKITDLYDSVKFNRDKYKYHYFLKLDIQRFFPSIYTHSLPWAIFGDKALAKRYMGRQYDKTFANATDIIIRKINFNETHGLVVGPEFSRVISEILLTRIDINLLSFAKENKLEFNRDYTLYRFIDDYFLFSLRQDTSALLENQLKNELDNYNLTLNIGKSQIQERPFQTSDQSIIALRGIIKEFEFEKLVSSIEKDIIFQEFKGMKSQWKNLFFKIENLISKYPESRSRIVNYFLKAIRQSVFYDDNSKHKYIIAQMLEVVSSIYVHNISTKSTIYLLSIYIKLLQKTNESLELNRENQDDLQSKDDLLHSALFINEKIFQHLFMILKNNISKMDDMFEVLVFLKSLEKKLSSSFLCKILDNYKHSYFVCCSVAYYILNEQLDGVDKRYLTVLNKLEKTVFNRINDYEPKGSKFIILEGEYFYLLNDFSFYPGFGTETQTKLRTELQNKCNLLLNNINDTTLKNTHKDVLDIITSNSYYAWHTSINTFIRKIVKKSSNMSKIDSTSSY